MRKLPVFFLVDVSESMAGPAHDAVMEGLGAIVRSLRSDPQALETVHLSVIAFAGRAKVLVPMTELIAFYPPDLPIGGGTSLGAAFEVLMNEIDAHVVRAAPDRKGDWKPIVFLMTDGYPTDNSRRVLERWRRDYARHAQLVAVSVGGGADHKLLREIAEEVIILADASPDSFRRFVRWMSDSISMQSRAVEGRGVGGVSLVKDLPEGARRLAEDEIGIAVDDRLAVFVARCQHTEAPYLLRFERSGTTYTLRQTLALRPSYFDLSEPGGASGPAISVDRLRGSPACPHCAAQIGMVSCRCGGIHCIDGAGAAICPWCGAEADYQPAPEGMRIEVVRGVG